ncbi:hypothetical protein RJ639_013808, partial [Escallonia herrerae]
MASNLEVHDPHFSDGILAEIAENLKDFSSEQDNLSYEEFLLQQEFLYLSLQEEGSNHVGASHLGQSSDLIHLSGQDGETSWSGNDESQLVLDEALALSLMYSDDGEDFADLRQSGHSGTAAGNTERSATEAPATAMSQAVTQDNVNPDNMTYEELRSLGETVGVESKGLPEELISQLPTFKYKPGFFSKKLKNEQCVVCCEPYSSGERLTTLPCSHQYHSECINRWLKVKKVCDML